MVKTTCFVAVFFMQVFCLHAQELFVFSEPASNMASKSIGLRLNNYLLKQNNNSGYAYLIAPEIMMGLSKKIMVHAEGFFSNRDSNFKFDAASFYIKYRFYSEDDVHSHFRIAAYSKAAVSNMFIHHQAIDLSGSNSGYEAGLVATKLINKVAISAGSSFVHVLDNSDVKKYYFTGRNAVLYNISLGKLLLPKEYINYNQLNVNGMIEMLGETKLYSGNTFMDVAPSLQFIIKSRMRIDAGYRFAVIKQLQRKNNSVFLIRLEYNIFNAYK